VNITSFKIFKKSNFITKLFICALNYLLSKHTHPEHNLKKIAKGRLVKEEEISHSISLSSYSFLIDVIYIISIFGNNVLKNEIIYEYNMYFNINKKTL